MNGWFLAIIILYSLSLGLVAAKNGQKKEGNYSFFASLISAAIFTTLIFFAIKTGF